MEVLAIALIGPRDRAEACAAALGRNGWRAEVGDDGPGSSGVDNTNPRLLEELGVDDFKVVDVEVGRAGELAEVQEVALAHGFRLRLHGWVVR